MKIKVIAILPSFIPSTIIDVVNPLIDLHKKGILDVRIKLEVFINKKDIDWCDIAVLCRNTEPLSSQWLNLIIKQKKPYIYDIDDNLFELSTDTRDGRYHKNAERIKLLTEYISLANLVRVYSYPMWERVNSINPNVVKIDAPVDLRLISPFKENKKKGPIKIVYTTSRVDDSLSEIFKPALFRLLKLYPKEIQMFFLGFNPKEYRIFPNVIFKPIIYDYAKYLRSFSGNGFDIGLAPLKNDLFHRSKTNNKFREYGASHIAGVYSNIDVYSTCVSNKRTGLLVENTDSAWFDSINMLIEKNEFRKYIQNQAYEYVRHHYDQESFVESWLKQIQECKNKNDNKMIGGYSLNYFIDQKNTFELTNRTSCPGTDVISYKSKRIIYIFRKMQRDFKSIGLSFTINKIRNYFFILCIYGKISIQLFIKKIEVEIYDFFHRQNFQ